MRFPSRRGPNAKSPVEATYAAIVGDRWLWVALAVKADVSLRSGTEAVTLPVEVDDTQPGHHGVRLDLSALPSADVDQTFVLHVDGPSSGPLTGPEPRPSGRASTHSLTRDAPGHLHVVRRPLTVGATVGSLRLVGADVEIDLDALGAGEVLVLVDGEGAAVATLPVDAGAVVLEPGQIADAPPGDLRALVGEKPVRRRADDLADPGSGALLPPLHASGEAEARGRLRWSADGSLVVRVHERPLR